VERRPLGYTAAVVGVFALIVVGALALGGDEEEPQEAASDAATETGGELSSGKGWGVPRETQLAGGRGLRIAVRGPAGAALVIDYTPSQPPRFGSTD
jgi:hypothetical protein